jgi:DNA repair protein RadD
MLASDQTAQGKAQLKVSYQVGDQQFHEWFPAATKGQIQKLCRQLLPPFVIDRHKPLTASTLQQLLNLSHRLQPPAALILRKEGRYWKVRDRLFDLTTKPDVNADVA